MRLTAMAPTAYSTERRRGVTSQLQWGRWRSSLELPGGPELLCNVALRRSLPEQTFLKNGNGLQ